jgi:hypothetical protein
VRVVTAFEPSKRNKQSTWTGKQGIMTDLKVPKLASEAEEAQTNQQPTAS